MKVLIDEHKNFCFNVLMSTFKERNVNNVILTTDYFTYSPAYFADLSDSLVLLQHVVSSTKVPIKKID